MGLYMGKSTIDWLTLHSTLNNPAMLVDLWWFIAGWWLWNMTFIFHTLQLGMSSLHNWRTLQFTLQGSDNPPTRWVLPGQMKGFPTRGLHILINRIFCTGNFWKTTPCNVVQLSHHTLHLENQQQVYYLQGVWKLKMITVHTCAISTLEEVARAWQSRQWFWLFALHSHTSKLYTLHIPLSALHFTLSTLLHIHTLLFTLHTSTLHTSTLHTVQTPHCTLHTLHSTLYTPHSTLHTSTFHTPHSTLWRFTLHTAHSTLHTLHSTL